MKRVMAILLSVLLSTGIFAACSNDSGQSSTAASEESSASSAASEVSEEPAASGDKMKITVTRWGEIEENDAEK